ncbi:hypothetical protein E2562_009987 [Oryza meyeriana var. granulata]|uniref:Uncharacterized protein n=1 Tax=Oryza meyeriana var. granulata TaxID=110450 RepID=A0A6G1EGT2_9ORYZ|nr:hypothetical protein E2562_009987 [Oryza meyeriana var. granulata]
MWRQWRGKPYSVMAKGLKERVDKWEQSTGSTFSFDDKHIMVLLSDKIANKDANLQEHEVRAHPQVLNSNMPVAGNMDIMEHIMALLSRTIAKMQTFRNMKVAFLMEMD